MESGQRAAQIALLGIGFESPGQMKLAHERVAKAIATAQRSAEAEAERLREALRLIELFGYREGEEVGWINAHMRGIATSAIQGDDLSPYWRLFPQHRTNAALEGGDNADRE